MIVTELPVERLVPYARNPRNNTAAIDAVKASIAEFGENGSAKVCHGSGGIVLLRAE